ncbi:MAG: S8 family serine peptidase [Thermoplasmata archaeon]
MATFVALPGLYASSIPQGDGPVADVTEDVATAAGVTTAAGAEDIASPAFWKIDPELRPAASAGSKQWTQVEIITVRNSELAPVLNKYGARATPELSLEDRALGAISFRNGGLDGSPVTQRVWVPNAALAEISSLPGVLFIGRPPRVAVDTIPRLDVGLMDSDYTDIVQSLREQGIRPTNYPSIVEHKSLDVQNTFGITGDGINIALVDTTVDFNQPNLVGQWATVTNASSPYFGWPILLDSGTILFNLELWSVSSDFDRFPYPFFSSFGTSGDSFYSDMHYSIPVNATGFVNYTPDDGFTKRADPTGVSGTVNSSSIDRSYYVGDAADPNRIVSKSGNYRLGILKDDYLTTLYGERVGLLLVDWTTAGVYDTVYADLDFDLDFTNENPANVSQPRLYRDLDMDGLADLSGGLVYFISQTTNTEVGEVVITSAVGNETYALLANGFVAIDIVEPSVDLGMPRLFLNGSYWPSSTDVIAETLFTSTGEEKNTTTNLGNQSFTLNDFVTAVDTASLLANYSLGSLYDFSSDIEGALVEGVDYEIDMDTGAITWLRPLAPGADIDIAYQFDTWTVDFETGNITFDAPPTVGAQVTADYITGLPVPYSDRIAARHGLELFVPAAGDLVGLYGAFNQETHGTATATTAAGNSSGLMGSSPFTAGDLDTFGQAPNASIISIDMFKSGATISDAWWFAVEGINGVPGDPDDALISSNSWGWVDFPETGWDFFSRWKNDLITSTNVTFVQSMGNDGPGYGTMSSPTSPSSIMAGAGRSDDVWWLLGLAGGEQFTWPSGTGPLGPGPYGEVADGSSRGPDPIGRPSVDALGIGFGGIAGIPVNEFFDGVEAWDLFGGTSQAAPNLAGITALMIEAYNDTHTGYPTPEMIQAVLKTTADDVHQDVLSQGAGFANALRAVNAMMDLEGVTADVHEWVPGDYLGVQREMFVNLLGAGESDEQEITLTNRGDTPVTVDFSDGVYQRTGTFDFTWILNNTGAGDFNFGRPDWWILNKTGVWRTNDTNFPGFAQEAAADLTTLWDGADFMKVFTYSDPDIGAHTPVLFLRDWNDTNGNGTWEGPGTEDSLIGPVFFVSDLTFSRMNSRVVQSPGTRIHDGLGVGHGALFGTSDGTPTPVTLYVEFYERTDWSWLSLNQTSLDLGIGASGNVTANLTVPAGTAPGSYQGAIYYNDGTSTSTIPVLVNVPVTELPFNFGGGLTKGTLYEPNAFNPASSDSAGGDARWFWLDTAPATGDNKKMLYNLNWGNISSDAEILAFHAIPDADWTNDTIYGPSTFELLKSTARSPDAVATVEPFWEFLSSDVVSGLFFIKVQALLTTEPAESMSGNVGILTVNSNDVRVSTNDIAGVAPVSVTANVPIRGAIQRDPLNPAEIRTEVKTEAWTGLSIDPYPYTGGAYVDYLFNAPNITRTEIAEDTAEATWTLSFGSDIDMGIFYDADGDGTYTAADNMIGTDASGISNPEVATLEDPLPGTYWVHAAGFDVVAGDTYDLQLDTEIPAVRGLATAVTETTIETFEDETVLQDDPNDPYTASFVQERNLVSVIAIVAGVVGQAADDLDLFAMFDANDDGVLDPTDPIVASSTTPTAIESITLTLPANGRYFLAVHGWSVPAGATTFDMTVEINAIGAVSAFSAGKVPEVTLPPDTTTSIDVAWSFAPDFAEGVSTNFLFLSPGNAPFDLTQLITITFSYDITPPSFSAHVPAAGSTVSDPTPGVFVQIDDPQAGSIARDGEIDEQTIRVWLDGVDITTQASISVPHDTNDGYPVGSVLFVPAQPLLEGVHTMKVEAGDFAGNLDSTEWSFVIDTEAPRLDITSPPPGFATSASSITLTGVTEPGATVVVAGQTVAVDAVGGFSAVVSLTEGANAIGVSATDAIGNVASTTVSVTSDQTAPAISQLLSSAGLLTNGGATVISGVVDEPVALTVGGADTVVRADGSFEVTITLVEGSNAIAIVATDAAGNQASTSLTVLRDSTPPVLALDALPSETASATVTVSGTVESGVNFVTVNGQPVPAAGGQFSTDIALSFGSNEIFVEATDTAGNTKTIAAAVSYVPTGVTVASVGLILLPILAVVALVLGLIIGGLRMRGGRPPAMEPPKEGGT